MQRRLSRRLALTLLPVVRPCPASYRDRQNGHPDCRCFLIQIVALHSWVVWSCGCVSWVPVSGSGFGHLCLGQSTQTDLCIKNIKNPYTNRLVCRAAYSKTSDHLASLGPVQQSRERQDGGTTSTLLTKRDENAILAQLAQDRQGRLFRDVGPLNEIR